LNQLLLIVFPKKKIAKWLIQSNVKVAAMEATGVYWIPLFEILEDREI
jgi:hypothetical protein